MLHSSDARRLPGSGTISSINFSSSRSVAVIFSASAAISAFVESRHMMEAHPSGEITE